MKKGISDAGIRRLAQAVGGRETTPEEAALMEDLQRWMKETNEHLMGPEDDEDPRDFWKKYGEPLAEVEVWPPEKTAEFLGSEGMLNMDCVSLIYEGSGYDILSPESDEPSLSDVYRGQLKQLAEQHGFMMEDYSSWAACFYPK